MNKIYNYLQSTTIAVLLACTVMSCSQTENQNLINTIDEFNSAVKKVQPGEVITLADGTWADVEFKFKGKGTAESPITLTAENPGKVIISGQSNLQISGEHLVVSGLVFKDGYTPTSEVISFKTSKDQLANNTRVTDCVIDNFTNPERFDGDTWVAIYGKNNLILGNTNPDPFYLL